MNLASLGSTDETMNDEEKGYVLHEFGHVLGLEHEFQSPLIYGNEDGLTVDHDGTHIMI